MTTINHKIVEFSYEVVHYWKSLIFVFQEFFASISKIFILAGGLGTGLLFFRVLGLS